MPSGESVAYSHDRPFCLHIPDSELDDLFSMAQLGGPLVIAET